MNEDDVENFYQLYLYDFVRFEHICNHKDQKSEDKEYQVRSASVLSLVVCPLMVYNLFVTIVSCTLRHITCLTANYLTVTVDTLFESSNVHLV